MNSDFEEIEEWARELRRQNPARSGCWLHSKMSEEENKTDEQAIRELVASWLEASKRGDLATVLGLMADDVVFMVPGQEPFGKDAWTKRMDGIRVEGQSEILEIKVLGEWAWMRQRLRVSVASPNARPAILSGYTLAISRKKADGKWVLARDANLVMPEPDTK